MTRERSGQICVLPDEQQTRSRTVGRGTCLCPEHKVPLGALQQSRTHKHYTGLWHKQSQEPHLRAHREGAGGGGSSGNVRGQEKDFRLVGSGGG